MLKKYFDLELTAEEEGILENEFERLSAERWVDLFGFKIDILFKLNTF